MKILIIALLFSSNVFAIHKVVKFKAGSELSDKVKMAGITGVVGDDTAEAKKRIMRDRMFSAVSPVKFKAGSELADKVKSFQDPNQFLKDRLIEKCSEPEIKKEVCKEESKKYADVKKLADELVNLTVKCSDEAYDFIKKGDLKALHELQQYCEKEILEIKDEITKIDESCDADADGYCE